MPTYDGPQAVPDPGTIVRDAHRAAPLRPAVAQAIAIMNARFAEPLTLAELSAEVYVSPFHFCRMFAKATGASPGRYLTAVRMFEAKHLLSTTSMTVSDIVCSVGYSSVGTFTTRFRKAVGMTPSQFRDPDVGELLVALASRRCRMPAPAALTAAAILGAEGRPRGVSVGVRVELPPEQPSAHVLVGLFAESIPQRGPVAFTVARIGTTGTVTIDRVPNGNWHVMAVAAHLPGPDGSDLLTLGLRPGTLTLAGGDAVAHVPLRPLSAAVPPMSFSLAGPTDAPIGDDPAATTMKAERAVA